MTVRKTECPGINNLVINKKPYRFDTVSVGDGLISFSNGGSEDVPHGTIDADAQVYAVMYCDKLRTIAIIEKKPKPLVLSAIFADEAAYNSVIGAAKDTLKVRVSRQNEKINGYAANIAEKLGEGTEVEIMDAVDENDVIICPECGMQCDPGSKYCMECGAELRED